MTPNIGHNLIQKKIYTSDTPKMIDVILVIWFHPQYELLVWIDVKLFVLRKVPISLLYIRFISWFGKFDIVAYLTKIACTFDEMSRLA